MNIQAKRIIEPQRYLYALQPNDPFYIVAPLKAEDYRKLEFYGIRADNIARIPIPNRTATRKNANGHWRILKHLPKEMRCYEQAYHVIDWHGCHHYGTCWHYRMCFQREFVPPTELSFFIKDGILYSPLFINEEKDFIKIKSAINVTLEMLGHCEVLTSQRIPTVPPAPYEEVPWEILRPGIAMRENWTQYIDNVIEQRPKGHQAVIRQRHNHLWQMSPDFCVLGSQNFLGYVIYGFSTLNLFIFECCEIDNATYVFRGDWKSASQLTKTEVLSGHIHQARIYHTEKWYENVSALISHNSSGAA